MAQQYPRKPRTKCSGRCFTPSRIIITAYLPIFTLQRVEGRLFKPMAWTVAFALLGALLFSMLSAPVLASFVFPTGTREWHNPAHGAPDARYACGAGHGHPTGAG